VLTAARGTEHRISATTSAGTPPLASAGTIARASSDVASAFKRRVWARSPSLTMAALTAM
jgi:hypothetical protein